MTISDDDLAALNARNFARDGCAFWPMTARQLARRHGLKRRYSGGETGRLIGYTRIHPCKEMPMKRAQESTRQYGEEA